MKECRYGKPSQGTSGAKRGGSGDEEKEEVRGLG